MTRSIIVALVFNGVDVVTGVLSGVKQKDLKSAKLRDGLFKKVGFIVCYVLAFLLDVYGVEVGVSLGFKALPVIISYVILTEIVSILENVHRLNPDIVPEKILSLLNISNKE